MSGETPAAHPILSVYKGITKLQVLVPPSYQPPTLPPSFPSTGDAPTAVVKGDAEWQLRELGIIELHQTLFPPAPVGDAGEVADEKYSQQLSSPAGLAVLQRNWSLLVAVLFPCLRVGDPLADADGDAAAEGAPSAATQAAMRDCCVRARVTKAALALLREPGTMDRVYYSFLCFMRFFGWRVHDEQRGVMDRHRRWQERYEALAAPAGEGDACGAAPAGADELRAATEAAVLAMAVPEEGSALPATAPVKGWYCTALPRIVLSLCDLGFLSLAVGLVEFLLDEMGCGRLTALHGLVECTLLPCLECCAGVGAGHTRRLRKKLYKLTHSDSD